MILKQIYSDDPLLPEFMDACAAKGYNNNSSLKAIAAFIATPCKFIALYCKAGGY